MADEDFGTDSPAGGDKQPPTIFHTRSQLSTDHNACQPIGAGVQVTRQSTGVKAEQGAVRGKAEEVVALQEKVATLARHVDVYSRQVQDSFPYVNGAERHWSDQLGNDRSAPCGVGTGAVRIRSNIRLWEVARAGANWGAAWRSVVGCRRRRGIEGRGGQRMRRTTLGALSPRRMGLCRALLD
jgi:hypothetical protein